MPNLGEELCGEYLRYIKGCEFVSYNVTNPDVQGEIDVVGIDLNAMSIYICEVAIHTTGLQYVTNRRPDDFNRFARKFDKSIPYARKYFSQYTIRPMIWSPVVRINRESAKYNTMSELNRFKKHIGSTYDLDLELVINGDFHQAIQELKAFADRESSEFKSSVMRMFQIEGSLEKHLRRISRSESIRP